MKKRILSLTFFLFTICIFSFKSFAQQATPADNEGFTGRNDLIFNLGATTTFAISKSAPFFPIIQSALSAFHVPIIDDVVSFPNLSAYQSTLILLYVTKFITYYTLQTASKNPPVGLH